MQNQTQSHLKKEDPKEATSNEDGGKNSWWGIDEHIKMRETVLEGVALFYASEPQACAKIYVENLNKLAYLYIEAGRKSEAMELADMAAEVMEPLYANDAELWEEEYCNNLLCMVATYPYVKESRQGIHPEELALPMMEKLFIINPERWAEDYVSRLNDIGIFYDDANQYDTALTFMSKALDVAEKMYERDPNSWEKLYLVDMHLVAHLLMDKEAYEESLSYFKKYFDLFSVQNIHLAEDCRVFIYLTVKYYQCALLAEDKALLPIISQQAKSSDTYFRDTFKDEYITILEKDHNAYRRKMNTSQKALYVQQYETYTQLFMPQ